MNVEDLDDIARRLREHRPEASALELDHIKTRAMARARSSRPRGAVLRTRLLAALACLGLMAGATGGVIAAQSGNPGKGSASKGQYGDKPGKGCGDKNHDHTGPPGKNGDFSPCPPTAGGGNSGSNTATPPGQAKKGK
jgi:hypothetical protein